MSEPLGDPRSKRQPRAANSTQTRRDAIAYSMQNRTVRPRGSEVLMKQGTLEPDQRPSLHSKDAGFLFYSTDFVRLYVWTGTAWAAIQPDMKAVSFFTAAPSTNGWHLCDGSTGVRCSKPDGTTELIDLPLLTGGSDLKGGTSYSGPNPTAATAPSASDDGLHDHSVTGTAASDGSHTHGGATGSGGAHDHAVSGFSDFTSIAHTHGVTVGGTTSSDGAHAHAGSTYTIPANTFDHYHAYSDPTGNNSAGHTHNITGSTDANDDSEESGVIEGSVAYAADGHSHSVNFVSGGESATHYHTIEGATDPSVQEDPFSGSVTVVSDGAHTHTFSVSPTTASGDSNHRHNISFTSGAANPTTHTHTITSDGSHTHTVSGSTSGDGTHTHTISATGEPKRMTLLPYIRL